MHSSPSPTNAFGRPYALTGWELMASALSLAALATLLGGVHSLARTLIDLATVRTITGWVL